MYINVTGHPKRRRLFFVRLVCRPFQPVLACYGMFCVATLFTSDDVAEYLAGKFTINQPHIDFITNRGKRCYKIGQL